MSRHCSWNPEQLAYLRENYASLSMTLLSADLGISETAVRGKANSLGLKRDKDTLKQGQEAIKPGSTRHRILLALRAGDMTYPCLLERLNVSLSNDLRSLERQGYITRPETGIKGGYICLTASGREQVSPAGPLARAKTLINYCHL